MLISTQPLRFMMQPSMDTLHLPNADPDAIDFVSFFAKQDAYNLRFLTALRMNATFPVVLPNVWLPSNPVIDVMDAGLRDNYGQETTLRFLTQFEDWVKENTSGVLVLQIRDRAAGAWEHPYVSENLGDHISKPFLLLQHNWFTMMEYAQNDMLHYFSTRSGTPIYKIAFQYHTDKEENKAALNFHLTKLEQKDILQSIYADGNQRGLKSLQQLLQAQKDSLP
jgi:hypothetical protein